MNSLQPDTTRFLVAIATICFASFLSAQQVPVPSPSSAPKQDRRAQSSADDMSPRSDAGRNNDGKLSRSDRNFLEEAAKSGHKEVQVSQAVLGKLTNPAARDFAQMMVSDHTAANQELEALAARKGVTLPQPSSRWSNQWSDKTRNVDSDYVEEMEDDHQKAIDLFEKATKSDDPEIAAFAQKTLPKLRQHLNQLESQISPAMKR